MLAKEEAFIARFKARASHAAQVQSRVKKLEKIERVEPPRAARSSSSTSAARRARARTCQARGREEGLRRSRTIYDDFDLLIRRRERWCVMGVNGAGKSTLLKLVAGATPARRGEVTIGASVKLGYFAQHAMELLDPKKQRVETLQAAFRVPWIGSNTVTALSLQRPREPPPPAPPPQVGAGSADPPSTGAADARADVMSFAAYVGNFDLAGVATDPHSLPPLVGAGPGVGALCDG
jgi:hypothetical protein